MNLISLTIENCHRFALANIKKLKFRPNNKTQLILGTNGSGKSSFMEHCVPYLANRDDFNKNGLKTIECMHRGNHYVLTNSFGDKTLHSFVRNGIELNESGNATVQKELTKQHLGLTHDISRLILNKEKFSEMSPTRKREWFSILSPENYDYAFKLFQSLKEGLRDKQGALKETKRRLINESGKFLSEEEERRIRNEMKLIEEEIAKLQEIRSPVEKASEEILYDIRQGEASIESINGQTRKAYGLFMKRFYNENVEETMSRLEGYKIQSALQEAQYRDLVSQHEELSDMMTKLNQIGGADREDITKRLRANIEIIGGLLSELSFIPTTVDYGELASAIEACNQWLPSFIDEMPNNKERNFSTAKAKEKEEEKRKLDQVRETLEKERIQLQAQKHHAEQHAASKNNTCPKCHYVWTEGYTQEAVTELNKKIEDNLLQLKTLDESFKKIIDWENSFFDYQNKYRFYINSTRSYPALNFFWNEISEKNWLLDAPTLITIQFSRLFNVLSTLNRITVLMQDNKELSATESILSKIDLEAAANAKEKISDIENKMTELVKSLNWHREAIDGCVKKIRYYNDFKSLEKKLEDAVAKQESLLANYLENSYYELIIARITELQIMMGKYAGIIDEITIRQNLIKDLESQIEVYKKEVEAYQLLIEELSPTHGLIAESIMGFVKLFITSMNSTIAKIWSYPLKVLPCGINTENGFSLDYKFKIQVGSKANIKKDVNEGSTGIIEVIDRAYVITAMKFLDMTDWPLYLDEFGASFDPAHQSNAVYAIKGLLESTDFSQLFMVSHYENSYGALSNADVSVLCSKNIIIPNQVVVNQNLSLIDA